MIQRYGGIVLSILAVCSTVVGVNASHQWGAYHRDDSTIDRYYFAAINGYDAIWADEAINDSDSWQNFTVMSLPTSTSHYFGCLDEVGGYASFAGTTGWAGLTTLDCNNGDLIQSAQSVFNRTYTDSYSSTDKHKIACHELGHSFGLDHQDVTDSCMNPTATNGADHPNDHDAEELASIYP